MGRGGRWDPCWSMGSRPAGIRLWVDQGGSSMVWGAGRSTEVWGLVRNSWKGRTGTTGGWGRVGLGRKQQLMEGGTHLQLLVSAKPSNPRCHLEVQHAQLQPSPVARPFLLQPSSSLLVYPVKSFVKGSTVQSESASTINHSINNRDENGYGHLLRHWASLLLHIERSHVPLPSREFSPAWSRHPALQTI